MALSIVPTLIAVVKMAAMMHRMSNRPEPFVITPSTPDRSGEKAPQSQIATGAPGEVT
jgi:hypothetical protein